MYLQKEESGGRGINAVQEEVKKIKNVIFDLGGVLVGLDAERCIRAFGRLGAGKVARYVAEHRTEDFFLDTETGRIGKEEFCERARAIAGNRASDQELVDAWNQLLTDIPDRKKKRLLQLRKAGYRLFLLSNTNVMHWELCATQLFNYGRWSVKDYFERCFLSYEMHLIKPSAEIFQEVLRQAEIVPEETLFIDDTPENCESARRLGIRTFLNAQEDDWLEAVGTSVLEEE